MWTCEKCGEAIEDQFESCWKCAAASGPSTGETCPKFLAKCLACGSDRLVKGVKVVDKVLVGAAAQSLEYYPQRDGTSLLPKIVSTGTVAVVCGDCGFTSFYATNYKAVLAAFEENP